MQPQGELSQSPGQKIQYFWEWFSFKTDKLKEYEPQRRVENVIMWTGFRHADELYIEIPGVYKKIGVVFSDNKIEVRKIEE